METRINVLPKEIADKIAAGEVIERPASIVKELLENAVDAGADDIVIELEEGGKGAIRITDNGSGIDARDVELAFERHATSKIRNLEDIYRIESFGFRGEALPSIAAVSDMELLTRCRGELSGVRALIEGGIIKEVSSIGCPEGTTISVRNIFSSIPARRKFLKKDAIEQGNCLDVVTRLALAHPEIKITVTNNGKKVLKVPKAGDSAEKIALILGMDFRKKMIPITGAHDGIRIRGYVSQPDFVRTSSKSTFFYVNNRSVRDALIMHALMNAYRGQMEARKYPSAVLFIDLPADEVDVNVHPAKTEVRFRDSKKIYEIIFEAVAVALSGSQPAVEPESVGRPLFQPTEGREPAAAKRFEVNDSPYKYFVSSGGSRPLFQGGSAPPARPRDRDAAFDIFSTTRSEGLLPKESADQRGFFTAQNYLGQIGATYLVFEGAEGMVLLDQHAAHERILYERLKAAETRNPLPSQALLIPEVVNLLPAECAMLSELEEVFHAIGMEMTVLGSDTVVVKTLPGFIAVDTVAVIKDMIAEISELGKVHTPEQIKEKIFASLACKGAVKANDRLSEREVEELCRDLDRIPNAATCPHGRPVYIEFSVKALEKMFKRS